MAIPLAGLLAAAIPAVASFAGGLFRNKAERDAAREQMAFQERMSGTSYQRATADMRMSGINPMLAYQQGGASTPGGAMPGVSDVLGPAVSSAMAGSRMKSELESMDIARKNVAADTQVKTQQAANIHTDTLLKGLQHALTEASTAKMLAETGAIPGQMAERAASRGLMDVEARFKEQEIARGGLSMVGERAASRAASGKFGEWMAYIQKLRESILGSSPFFIGPRIGGGR